MDTALPVETVHCVETLKANLLLNFAPTYDGTLPPESVAQYRAFGGWISACYGATNLAASMAPGMMRVGDVVELVIPPLPATAHGEKAAHAAHAQPHTQVQALSSAFISRVVLEEDQSAGQRVRGYTVEVATLTTTLPPTNVTGQRVRTHPVEIPALKWATVLLGESIGTMRVFRQKLQSRSAIELHAFNPLEARSCM
jgi:hypothetical protein